MRFIFRLSLYLLPLLALPLAGLAQAPNDGTLHVLRPIMHAEQDKAELCLEFDHPLDTTDPGLAAMSIRLESNGKNIAASGQNLSPVSAMLCLPSLDHHRDYHLTVSGLRGADNEKLAEPYRLSFTVPDRHPALAFVSDRMGDGVIRWQDNDPVLRAINVTRAHIELYRITDPALMVEAWRQRLQTALAPTESAYFARHNGQLVWRGDMVLGDAFNNILEQKIPLRAATGKMPSGFYLIIANAAETKIKFAKDELAPLAATWLLRSDLKIEAIQDVDGYYVTAEKSDASTILKDVHLIIEDSNQQPLADGKSDTDGIAFLPLAGDKLKNATTLIGLTDEEDADFSDLTKTGETHFIILPDLETSMTTDKLFYPPGALATVTLTAYDRHGHAAGPEASRLQILRPDRSSYIGFPVSKDQSGVTHLSFPVPAGNGVWTLIWQQDDGRPLTESKLRITANKDAPHLEMNADRTVLSNDGAIALNLQSLTGTGKPASYLTGHILVSWIAPDHVFPGHDGYNFGNGENKTVAATPIATFITDENGMAQLHLSVIPPNDNGVLRAAILSVQSDPAAGAADPAPLTLPVKPVSPIIGIKPSAPDGKFAENSLAHFDVIALDSDGKRHEMGGLTYQIYEEGRSFDWYQAEGRWDYKPLQQHRRIGGGALTVKADGSNGIDWPVTAGTYRLEITDANGIVRARTSFSAGWGLSKTESTAAPLTLTLAAPMLQAGEATKVRFKLDQPTLVSAVIADDRIRKVVHQLKPPGDSDVSFTPEEDWGDNVGVWIKTASLQANGNVGIAAGKVILPLSHNTHKTGEAIKTPTTPVSQEILPALAVTGLIPTILKTDDTVQLTLNLKNNTASVGSYHYVLSSLMGLKIFGIANGTLTLAAGQSRDLSFVINAAQTGAQELKLEITGPRNFHLNPGWVIAVTADNLELSDTVRQSVMPQQSWHMAASDKNRARAGTGYLFVAPQSLFDLPQILSSMLQSHSFTSRESASELEVLRLWHDTIIQAGLLPEQKLLSRQRDLLMRLLSRQKSDGGFPLMPGGEADMVSTASVLIALGYIDQPLAKTAVNQAADWLKHKLDNSWFDEAERPDRAMAYMALAIAGHLDPAGLHYFADTSVDKSLPPLAAAQLALAFIKSNDSDKAAFWLNTIPKTPAIAADLLPLLADNTAFDAESLLPALEKISGEITKKPTYNFETTTAFLRALWNIQNRAGTWRVAINNGEQNLKNVLVVRIPEKSPAFIIHNPTDKPLFLIEAHETKTLPASDSSIARHIYRLNGNEMALDALHRDETYLVVVEGLWFTENTVDSILVRDHLEPALHPVSCALSNAPETNDSLAWLKNLLLTSSFLCEKSGDTVDVLLEHKDTAAKLWRMAYLAKPEWSGTFNLTPVSVRDLAAHQDIRQGRVDQVRIQ